MAKSKKTGLGRGLGALFETVSVFYLWEWE